MGLNMTSKEYNKLWAKFDNGGEGKISYSRVRKKNQNEKIFGSIRYFFRNLLFLDIDNIILYIYLISYLLLYSYFFYYSSITK